MKTMTEEQGMAAAAERLENLVPAQLPQGMNKSTDLVRQAMNRYVDDGRITAEQLEVFVRLFQLGKGRGYSFDDTGKLVDYSGATMSRLFSGQYDGNLEKVVAQVEAHLQVEAEREKMRNDRFIENSIWKKVENLCVLAQNRNAPVRLVGPSQIGKTFCLMEFKRRSKLQVCYVRVPAAPTFKLFADAICDAVGVPTSLRLEEARIRVRRAISNNTLLIVDELHELVMSAGKSTAMKCMEWLREIHDMSKCGLVMCGTTSMEDDLINDPKMKGWLVQMDQRCIRITKLPNRIPEEDIDLAAAAYGITGPKSGVENLLATIRMNRLTTCLAVTARWCNGENKRREKHPKNWESFRSVYKSTFGTEV